MAFSSEPPASRTGRDRDLLPAGSAPGPYETPYDVRRDYQQPLRRRPPRLPAAGERMMPREEP
jgi:hypothetical protein